MPRIYGKPTKAQQEFVRSLPGMEGGNDTFALSSSMDARSNLLREFYLKGQKMFRHCNGERADVLNEIQQELKGPELAGFMMGWNSDAAAEELGLQPAVEGSEHIIIDEDTINEFTKPAQGSDVLDESSFR